MRTRSRSIAFIATSVVALLWILVTTLVFWNMDPKFGGPYRWATFALPDYWLISFLPSTILTALALAAEHRWRRMLAGAESYRYLGDVSAPATMAVLITLVVTLFSGSFQIDLLEINYPWRSLQYPLLILFGMFLGLLAPISTRVWIILAVGYPVLSFVSILVLFGLTESGILTSRNSSTLLELFFKFARLMSSIIFMLACVQIAIHLVFWVLFGMLGKRQTGQ
ncbi:MAG: hypothetical protein ABJ251_15395 [Paracoccaceae bacterium]